MRSLSDTARTWLGLQACCVSCCGLWQLQLAQPRLPLFEHRAVVLRPGPLQSCGLLQTFSSGVQNTGLSSCWQPAAEHSLTPTSAKHSPLAADYTAPPFSSRSGAGEAAGGHQ